MRSPSMASDRARTPPGVLPRSVLVALGSNLGDRAGNLRRGLELLAREPGVEVVRVSEVLETEPVGGPSQGPYLNTAAEVVTTLGPRDLLAAIHRTEAALGRVRTVRDGPRTLDLDILLFADEVVREPGLEIPHPRMLERSFVLDPLVRIAPDRRHPVTGRTVLEHWRDLRAGARETTPARAAMRRPPR